MQLRWSPAAVEDLFRIIQYIRRENAPAAQSIAKTIYENAGSLKSFPNKGREGRVEGTRELPSTTAALRGRVSNPQRHCGDRKRYPRRAEMAATRVKAVFYSQAKASRPRGRAMAPPNRDWRPAHYSAGRSLPLRKSFTARSRPSNSADVSRPCRYNIRRKSHAGRSFFRALHSTQQETRLR